MDSAFELLPNYPHSAAWRKAYDQDPHNRCPGKDPLDQKCSCPDVMYATRVRLLTAETIASSLYCGCCNHPIRPVEAGIAGQR